MSARRDDSEIDAIIELGAVEVAFVSGDKRLPIPQQAPSAFNVLELLLPSLKRKRFYGAVIDARRGARWKSKKPNLRASHHEPLILRARAGDGPGTRTY